MSCVKIVAISLILITQQGLIGQEGVRPYVFLETGLNLLTQADEHTTMMLSQLRAAATQDAKFPFIDLSTDFPGRDPVHLKHQNLSYDMARGISERLGRSAMMFLITKDLQYKERIITQLTVLFDDQYFPHWCDDAHMHQTPYVDIRTYRISMWIALCYNWLYDEFTAEERSWILEGLDRKAIRPFWVKLAQRPGWYLHRHNWFTNMFGGMGITMMALHDDHPDTKRALDTIVPAMLDFNLRMGDHGEFNEPPGYVGAVRFQVEFAEAYRTYTRGKVNLLAQHPFPQLCYWIMHHTLPPGHLTAFGDTNPNQAISDPAVVAAVAGAANDPILQGYYLDHTQPLRNPLELLWYTSSLAPESPSADFPLAVAYEEYGSDIISRTDWGPKGAASIVYSKAGRETNHDDNDVGQVCIDGLGHPLIIDCGKPKPIYPKDYFGPSQFQYYSRSSRGHNIIVLDDEEIFSEPNQDARGVIDTFWSDNLVGAFWTMDLSPVYRDANVKRSVAHLHPGLVVVVDRVHSTRIRQIDLRWHTADTPVLHEEGNFSLSQDPAVVAAKMDVLESESTLKKSHQEYLPPYHLTRQGDPLEQDYEDFVQLSTSGSEAIIISLFAVQSIGDSAAIWTTTDEGWSLSGREVSYEVSINTDQVSLSSGDKRLTLPLE